MKYNPDIHHRRSIRLKGYDYSQTGTYFVTICVQNQACLFGKIANREMILNDAGKMIEKWWLELQNKFSNFVLNTFVVMPNHFHGIVIINNKTNNTKTAPTPGPAPVGAGLRVCPKTQTSGNKHGKHVIDECKQGEHIGSPLQYDPPTSSQNSSLPKIIQWFKTMTTNEYIRDVKSGKFSPFEKRVWQRNYHEHIIRNEQLFEKIQNYIIHNPQKWPDDKFFVN